MIKADAIERARTTINRLLWLCEIISAEERESVIREVAAALLEAERRGYERAREDVLNRLSERWNALTRVLEAREARMVTYIEAEVRALEHTDG